MSLRERFSAHYLWLIAGVFASIVILVSNFVLFFGVGYQDFVISLILFSIGIIGLLISFVSLLYQHLKTNQSRVNLERKNLALIRDKDLTQSRLVSLFQMSEEFLKAESENQIVEVLLRQLTELVGAVGASYVALDDRGQPITTRSRGEFPYSHIEAWIEYLASPAVRSQCSQCNQLGSMNADCPILNSDDNVYNFQDGTKGIYCLPLYSIDKEIGIINLFFPTNQTLDKDTTALVTNIIDEASMALERIRLRENETQLFQHLQNIRSRTELNVLLNSLLDSLCETIEAEFAVLTTNQSARSSSNQFFSSGMLPQNSPKCFKGIIHSVLESGAPVLIRNFGGGEYSMPDIRSIISVPLQDANNQPLGVLLAGKIKKPAYQQRHIPLMNTIASHIVLVLNNTSTIAEIEYKTTIEERTRIAREIHDGLAQTLGYLKLKAAQMRNHIERDEIDRVNESLAVYYQTLSDAYQDAREAIDNLRLDPYEKGVAGWLTRVVDEFRLTTQINTQLEMCETAPEMLPEIHAQLVRIVQEALSNVRKHAKASNVWIRCAEIGIDLLVEIRDDGIGFAPDFVSESSQYGLKSMKERAELIGAEFQIISNEGEGTIVRIAVHKNVEKLELP